MTDRDGYTIIAFHGQYAVAKKDMNGTLEMVLPLQQISFQECDEKLKMMIESGKLPKLSPEVSKKENSDTLSDKSETSQNPSNTVSSVEVFNDNGKFGVKDSNGQIRVKPQYDQIYGFSFNGLALVEKGGKYGMIDTNGREVIPSLYDQFVKILPSGEFLFVRSSRAVS